MRLTSMMLASLVVSTGVAAADDGLWAMGARVGGYGFRRDSPQGPGQGTQDWNECRMNGIGVFGQRVLRGPLFVEAGLDTYSSVGQGAANDLPIDRQNALVSIAAGARTAFTPWLRGYIQLGAGVELARLSVPYGDGTTIHDNKAMPDGFVGIGADVRVAHGTFLGATMRTLVMGNFNYDPARLQMANAWVAPPPANDVFSASPTLAAQAQFYLRREL